MSRILVIDDSPTVITFVRDTLAADGHEVSELASFIELPKIIEEDPPDLILLDLNIPAIAGLSFGRQIRAHQRADIPLIVYSSRPEEELAAAADELEAFGYVRKADGADGLRWMINRALIKSVLRQFGRSGSSPKVRCPSSPSGGLAREERAKERQARSARLAKRFAAARHALVVAE